MQAEFPDDALNWFLNQAKSKDHHALGINTYKHIFKHRVSVIVSLPLHVLDILFTDESVKSGEYQHDRLESVH
jgi:hypothetical protein